MKVETGLCRQGKTKLVEDVAFPLKVKAYREVFCDLEGNPNHQVRQYVVEMEYGEDKFQVTGENHLEVSWKIGRILLALMGEE